MAESSPVAHFDLRTRIVTAPESSFHSLIAEQKKRAMSTIDRHQRARQVYRFRNHLLETDKTSPKLKRIEEADPGFEYLKVLHWDDSSAAESELKWLEIWEQSPDGPGQFGSWLGTSFKKWRQDWVKSGKLPVPRPTLPQGKEDSEQQPAPTVDAQEDTADHGNTGSVGDQETHDETQQAQDPSAAASVTRDGDAPQDMPLDGRIPDGRFSDAKGKQVDECAGAIRQVSSGSNAGVQPFGAQPEPVTNNESSNSSFSITKESTNTSNRPSPPAYVNPQSYPVQPAPTSIFAFASGPKTKNDVPGSSRARPQPPLSHQPSQISFGSGAMKINTASSQPEPQSAQARSPPNATFGSGPMANGNAFETTQADLQPSRGQPADNAPRPTHPVSPRPWSGPAFKASLGSGFTTTNNIFSSAQAQQQTFMVHPAPTTASNASGPSQGQWKSHLAQALFGSGATVTNDVSGSSQAQNQPSQRQPLFQKGFSSAVITPSNMFGSTQADLHASRAQSVAMTTNDIHGPSQDQSQPSEVEPLPFRAPPATMTANNVSGSSRSEQAPKTRSGSRDAQRRVAYHLKKKATVDGSGSAAVSSQQTYTDEELRDVYDFYRLVYRPKKRGEREREGQQ